MGKGWWIGILVLGFTVSFAAGWAAETPEKAATSASLSWLAHIDAGKYAESWKEASSSFRGVVDEDVFVKSLNGIRKLLGNLVSRKLKSAKYMRSLPGAPDGKYVVMQFDAEFLHKKAAVETVTFMQEKDGKWRAAGYYLK